MKLLAIDPSLRATGWALFEDEVLDSCGLWRPRAKDTDDAIRELGKTAYGLFLGENVDNIVIERPQVYPGEGHKKAKDVVTIALVGGAIAGAIGANDWTFVLPREWKGTVPKDKHNAIVLHRLETEERLLVYSCGVPKGLTHNVIDAVGIGLWALGRL